MSNAHGRMPDGSVGTSLGYNVTGSRPIVLLIHGGVMDSTMFGPFARLLADSYTVVTYDHRGPRRGVGDPARRADARLSGFLTQH